MKYRIAFENKKLMLQSVYLEIIIEFVEEMC